MSSGMHVRAMPPITVTAQIHFHPDGPNGKIQTVSKGSKSTKDEKRTSEAAVDATASGSVEQT